MKNKIIVAVVSVIALVAIGFSFKGKDIFEKSANAKIAGGPCFPEGMNGEINTDADLQAATFNSSCMKVGALTDSTVVRSSTGYLRRTAPVKTQIASYLSTQATVNSTPARSLVNTTGASGFQVSTTKGSWVTYTVTHTNTLTLIQLSAVAKTFLEISPTGAAGTWTAVCSAGLSRTVSVAVVVTENSDLNLSGYVPAGYYVRLRTANTGGGSTTYLSGQEVSL